MQRRAFLRRGAAVAAGGMATAAGAQTLEIPPSNLAAGRPMSPKAYGARSKFEEGVTRNRTDVLVNRQNWSDWSMSPIQKQLGIITPNGLFFERHHAGVPDINPDEHRLVIHGMVRQPLVFTMSDLMKYPSVSRFYFLECSGNGLTDWTKAASTTVQQSHGLLSCGQWTGVPLSWLLDEAGIDPKGKWMLFEGADGAGHTRSIPLEKAMLDTLIVYGQNGEMLRPEQGYPLRAFVPGLGRQRQREVAAPHQGERPAVALPQRDRALHGPDARGQVAAVQLRDGSEVGHHQSVGRPEAHAAGPGGDRGLRVVGQRHHPHGRRDRRRRPHLAPGASRGAGARQVPHALPLRLALGRQPRADRQPLRRQHRLRPADGGRDRQGPRAHAASCSTTTACSRGPSPRTGR